MAFSPRTAFVAALGVLVSAHTAPQPRKLATVNGLKGPESLSYDAAHDAYFVSNVNGAIGIKHDTGFIARVRGSDGRVDSLHFIQGGRNGVTLNSPMGSRVKGDTLWVVDIDALRGFDTRTGAPLASIDLSALHPLFLNDVALGPDDDFYITDTGVQVNPDGKSAHTGPDRILHIGRDRKATVALSSAALSSPDGIDWEPAHRRILLAPFGGSAVQEWKPGTDRPNDVAPGKGKFDGIEVERDGTVLITSWNDSSVSSLEGNRLVRRVAGLDMPPADASMDARRRQVGIVSLAVDRFELWTLP
jgi:sugar lactone lactonase YvrE